jgi:signal peptidase I
MKEFLDLMRNLVGLILIFLILFNFVIGIETVQADDMKPGLRAGDTVIFYRIDKQPAVREIIILKKDDREYIGRVVAAAGDKVEINEDSCFMVNDSIVSEEDVYGNTPAYEGYTDYPLVLSDDEYFVLCDRRGGGIDSRFYGPVRSEEIIGTVIGRYRKGSV